MVAWTKEDVFWFKHDLRMDAVWDRTFGLDEPDQESKQRAPNTSMGRTTEKLRNYLNLQDELWTEIRQTVIG